MTYLSIVLLLFTVVLTYKKLASLSTYFLYGIIIGWMLSFFSYIFYISKFNVYYDKVSKFYDFSPGSWNRLVLENFDPNLLIRLFNIGIILFGYSFLLFSISYTLGHRKLKNLYLYIPIVFLMIIQIIYYDPSFNMALQDHFYSKSFNQGLLFNRYRDVIYIVTLWLKNAAIFTSFVLLGLHFIKNYRVHFLHRYTLYHIVCLFPVAVIHIIMFSWAPKILVKPTYLKEFPNYLKPQISNIIYEMNWFPIISIIALGSMIFTFSRYTSMEKLDKFINADINKKIKTASLGVKAFTHSIKNHMLAIRSEAEFLKERFASDPEAQYSLSLILKSCADSYQTINDASNKLNSISLSLKAIKLHVPIEKAIAKLSTEQAQIPITVKRESMGRKAFIDENHMCEVYYNIIINAIEALQGQEDAAIVITIEDQEDWGFVSIQDNGPGIAREHLTDVFSPFFSTKSSARNWGVGLSYCHKIVTAHNGKMEVDSQLKKGTVFKILLPLI